MENLTFSGLSLLDHNMYAVRVREDGGFEFTKEIFNIGKEQ